MSEKLQYTLEKPAETEQFSTNETTTQKYEAPIDATAEKPQDSIQQIRERLEQIKPVRAETVRHTPEPEPTQTPYGLQRELKQEAFRGTMRHVQSSLSTPSRVLSKIIHAPAVESISHATGKTVARPIGLFWGGLSSLLITSYSLYFAKQYGFEYNFGIVGFSFVSGYIVATIIEMISRRLSRNRQK